VGLTVGALITRFLADKQRGVDAGRRSPRTLNDYDRACKKIREIFGDNRVVSTLTPPDFTVLHDPFAETHGVVALGKDITATRVLFKYAFDNNLIERPLSYGTEFKKPGKKTLRKQRREKRKRMFQADELRNIIDKAGMQVRAMIDLGINCGLGNNDCAMLPMSYLDLDKGWLDYPRPKTEVDRRCPLWPETIEALRAALVARPTPKSREHQDRVFIARYRTTWEPKSISPDYS
jgi:integrase